MAEHPGAPVLFNACIFDKRGTEIWFGDLNLDADKEELQGLADEIGVIYVCPELPYRWRGLPKPRQREQEAEILRIAREQAA